MYKRQVRIWSAGPDQKLKTKWDLGVILTLPEPEVKKKKKWSDRLVPDESWLDKRKRELGLDEAEEKEKAENSYSFEVDYFAGGGTRLEGASYFWFFAGLMLVTAIGFIPYALRYRGKTILQN